MTDIVFMDTETLGLEIDSPIWEFAAIRRCDSGIQADLHIFIHHDPADWLDTLREDFVADYHARYDETNAFCWKSAARSISAFIGGAHVVGAVPDFDTTRIRHQLLAPLGIPDPWHYHLIDVENLIVGYLLGVGKQAVNDGVLDSIDLSKVTPPWSSNDLSAALGVDPTQFERHTAMGDVLWVQAQYDAMMGGAR